MRVATSAPMPTNDCGLRWLAIRKAVSVKTKRGTADMTNLFITLAK